MKYLIYIILFSFLFLSCKMKSKKESSKQPLTKELTKLEKLFLLPYDSVMVYYDLSNDNIENFPNLSAFTIKSLDLSHNLYCGFILIRKNTIPYLKELDISHNALNRIDIAPPLYRINVSYNDLDVIDLNHKNIQYLDISYNSDISERVSFEPLWIDTLVRDGVADGKRLLGPLTDIVIE